MRWVTVLFICMRMQPRGGSFSMDWFCFCVFLVQFVFVFTVLNVFWVLWLFFFVYCFIFLSLDVWITFYVNDCRRWIVWWLKIKKCSPNYAIMGWITVFCRMKEKLLCYVCNELFFFFQTETSVTASAATATNRNSKEKGSQK